MSAVSRVLCVAARRTSAAASREAPDELTSRPTRHAAAATGTNHAIPAINIAPDTRNIVEKKKFSISIDDLRILCENLLRILNFGFADSEPWLETELWQP
jgi:hypothetical protein